MSRHMEESQVSSYSTNVITGRDVLKKLRQEVRKVRVRSKRHKLFLSLYSSSHSLSHSLFLSK